MSWEFEFLGILVHGPGQMLVPVGGTKAHYIFWKYLYLGNIFAYDIHSKLVALRILGVPITLTSNFTIWHISAPTQGSGNSFMPMALAPWQLKNTRSTCSVSGRRIYIVGSNPRKASFLDLV